MNLLTSVPKLSTNLRSASTQVTKKVLANPQVLVNTQNARHYSHVSTFSPQNLISPDGLTDLRESDPGRLKSLTHPWMPLGLKSQQALVCMNINYALANFVQKCDQRYAQTPLIQMAHQSVPTHPGVNARITLTGDPFGCYFDYEQIVQKLEEFNADPTNPLKAWGLWPGWGLASEDYQLVDALNHSSVIPLMPPAKAMKAAGDKNQFELTCQKLGLPTLPAMSLPEHIDIDAQVDEIAKFVQQQRHQQDFISIMLKSAGGGGGKGMREYALNAAEPINKQKIKQLLISAKLEQPGDFLIQEKLTDGNGCYVKHWEQQMFGHTPIGRPRDCTHQKPGFQKQIQLLIPHNTDPALIKQMQQQCSILCQELGYEGSPGTVEFLVRQRGADVEYFFLEMNTRLQVEHPVTEASTVYSNEQGEVHPVCLLGAMIRHNLGLPSFDNGEAIDVREASDIRIDAVNPDRTTPWLSRGGFIVGTEKNGKIPVGSHIVLNSGPIGSGDSQVGSIQVTAPWGKRKILFEKMQTVLRCVNISGPVQHNLPFIHKELGDANVINAIFSNTRLADNEDLYVYEPLIPGNRLQKIEAGLRKKVIPQIIQGPTPTPSGHTLQPRVMDDVDAVVKKTLARPRQSGSLDEVKDIGWDAYREKLLASTSIKLEIRDIIQSLLGNQHTPQLWEHIREIISTTPHIADLVQFLEVPSGAAFQTRALQGGFPFDILKAALGEHGRLSVLPTGLVRCDFMWALEKLPHKTQQYIWQVTADIVEACIGRTKDGDIPFVWYTFDYRNWPETIAQSVMKINQAGMIGVPAICVQPGDTARFVSENVSKPLFEKIPAKYARGIVYLKEPCGPEDLDGSFADEIINIIRMIKTDHKEAYGINCVVMIHISNKNGYANVTNKKILDAFKEEGGVVLGGSVTGYPSHGDTTTLLKSSDKPCERFSALDADLAILLASRSEWNTGQTAQTAQGDKSPGGMGSSQIKEAREANIPLHFIPKIFELGREVLQDVGVTPGAQFMWQSGLIMFKQVWQNNHGNLDQNGKQFAELTSEDCKQTVFEYCESGNLLHLPDIVMQAIASPETVYPKTPLAQILLKNEPVIFDSIDLNDIFDADQAKKDFENKFRLPATGERVAANLMYPTQMDAFFKKVKDGMPQEGIVDDKITYCQLGAGDVFCYEGNEYTILSLDKFPRANGKRLCVLQNNQTGNIIADEGVHPDDKVGMQLTPLAEKDNPFQVGVEGEILEIQSIDVKVGDVIEKDQVLLTAKVAKVTQSIVAKDSQVGLVVKNICVSKAATNLEPSTLLIELEEPQGVEISK